MNDYKRFFGYKYLFLFAILQLTYTACRSIKATQFEFPSPVDTQTKEIAYQEKKVYSFPGNKVNFDNNFDGARLNDVEKIGKDSFLISILPENTPINPSPYFAFRVWSENSGKKTLILDYPGEYTHRYHPKISRDGARTWYSIAKDHYTVATDKETATMVLDIGPDTIWISAQELWNSGHVEKWAKGLTKISGVHLSEIGKSKLGRPLLCLDLYLGSPKGKEIIVLLSRQHPPEVTGFLALESFLAAMLADTELANRFREKYRILVYPLINPDGVDLGHWRHNAGGIDLNRDWAFYRQPEPRQVADHIVVQNKKNKSQVILGIDFHSTFQDVYYTFGDSMRSEIPGFKDYWIENIKNAIPGYEPDDKPSNLDAPISKGWFYLQFNAEGITFEIGDETPRDFIRKKGETAAKEMMKLLIFR